ILSPRVSAAATSGGDSVRPIPCLNRWVDDTCRSGGRRPAAGSTQVDVPLGDRREAPAPSRRPQTTWTVTRRPRRAGDGAGRLPRQPHADVGLPRGAPRPGHADAEKGLSAGARTVPPTSTPPGLETAHA